MHLSSLINILLSLILVDLSAAYRCYLKADDPLEVQYATKHLVIIPNEGFKKIYNYVWPNNKGDLITQGRNKSIWKKDIGDLVELKLPEFITEYHRLTAMLEEFDDSTLKAMKTPRDIFVHYDDIPSRAYDELQLVDIEIVSQKFIPFMNILQQMTIFCNKASSKYTKVLEARTIELQERLRNLTEN